MSSYLPKDTTAGSAYSEGGGLYALGLIHANHGGEITEYLLGQLKDASTDVSCCSCLKTLVSIVVGAFFSGCREVDTEELVMFTFLFFMSSL